MSAVDLPNCIVVSVMPAALRRQGIPWRLTLVFASLLIAFGAISVYAGLIETGPLIAVAGVIAFWIVVSLLVIFLRDVSQSKAANKSKESDFHQTALAILTRRPKHSWVRTWPEWNWLAMKTFYDDRNAQPPRIIIDEAARAQTRDIDLSNELLEPEPVGTSGISATWVQVLLCVWSSFMAVQFFRDGQWEFSLCFAALAIFYLIQIPMVRDAVPGLTRINPEPVAGVGWVRDPKGRTWTTDNATMVVASHAKGKKALVVHLVGDAGSRTFTYQSAADPEFISLWKRWAHPNPRPDLAGLV